MRKLFDRFRKTPPQRPVHAPATPLDADETIVVNLSGAEAATEEVRVEVEHTAPAPATPPPARAAAAAPDDAQTQIWTTEANHDAGADSADTAGLLMLLAGPQRGRLLAVSLGRNRIGRAPHNDITLATGDAAISNENHAAVVADPKTRQFFLVPGDSRNLAYIDDQPLLEARELADKAIVQIGDTRMMFIQLFGNYLDWP